MVWCWVILKRGTATGHDELELMLLCTGLQYLLGVKSDFELVHHLKHLQSSEIPLALISFWSASGSDARRHLKNTQSEGKPFPARTDYTGSDGVQL